MLRGLLALGVLVAVASTGTGHPASAAPVDASGYWWRFQVVAGAPVAPTGVTANQLYVAADAAGISGVAAVRVKVGDRKVDALVLTVAAVSGLVSLRACPTSGWKAPTGAGAWADRPPIDRCPGEGVPGVKAGAAWSFPVGDLVDANGVLDVAIVPGLEDQSVTFAPPGPDAIALAPLPAAAATDDGGAAASPAPTTAPPSPAQSMAEQTSPHAVALDQLADVPSSGLGAAAAAVPANAFDDDVVGLPAPTASRRGVRGARSPLALVAVLIIAGAWVVRTHFAVAAASAHPLFGPLRFRTADLAAAGGVLAAAEGAEPSGGSPALVPGGTDDHH